MADPAPETEQTEAVHIAQQQVQSGQQPQGEPSANAADEGESAPPPPNESDAAQYFSWVGKNADPGKTETR